MRSSAVTSLRRVTSALWILYSARILFTVSPSNSLWAHLIEGRKGTIKRMQIALLNSLEESSTTKLKLLFSDDTVLFQEWPKGGSTAGFDRQGDGRSLPKNVPLKSPYRCFHEQLPAFHHLSCKRTCQGWEMLCRDRKINLKACSIFTVQEKVTLDSRMRY